jgi:hypothetical protein
MPTYREYRAAAALLWGTAGEFAAEEFSRINREHFAGSVPPLPIVIGLTAFGRCIGLTRSGWLAAPRITLAPEIFTGNHRTPGGTLMVGDVLVHEMAHAALMLRGEDPGHNGEPWCRMLTELSPGVLGREVTAAPVGTRRVPNPDRESDPSAPKTKVVRRAEPGALARTDLAYWPQSLRPAGYYQGGQRIAVPTY